MFDGDTEEGFEMNTEQKYGQPDHSASICDFCHYSEVSTWDIGEPDAGAWERCANCGGPEL